MRWTPCGVRAARVAAAGRALIRPSPVEGMLCCLSQAPRRDGVAVCNLAGLCAIRADAEGLEPCCCPQRSRSGAARQPTDWIRRRRRGHRSSLQPVQPAPLLQAALLPAQLQKRKKAAGRRRGPPVRPADPMAPIRANGGRPGNDDPAVRALRSGADPSDHSAVVCPCSAGPGGWLEWGLPRRRGGCNGVRAGKRQAQARSGPRMAAASHADKAPCLRKPACRIPSLITPVQLRPSGSRTSSTGAGACTRM